MLKTCAAILPLILLVHTSCNLWCHHLENPILGPAHSCQEMPTKDGDSQPTPPHHEERCEDCLLKVVESKTFAPNLLKVALAAVPVTLPVIELQTRVAAFYPGILPTESPGSPPTHQVLLI